jgi:hypothetical protein
LVIVREIAFPRRRQINVDNGLRRRPHRAQAAPGGERLDKRAEWRARVHVLERQDVPGRRAKRFGGENVGRSGLLRRIEERPEVVRIGVAAATEKAGYANRHAERSLGLDVEREHAAKLAIGPGGEDVQLSSGTVGTPPFEEPRPCIDRAGGCRDLVHPVPLVRQLRELLDGVDGFDADAHRRGHVRRRGAGAA